MRIESSLLLPTMTATVAELSMASVLCMSNSSSHRRCVLSTAYFVFAFYLFIWRAYHRWIFPSRNFPTQSHACIPFCRYNFCVAHSKCVFRICKAYLWAQNFWFISSASWCVRVCVCVLMRSEVIYTHTHSLTLFFLFKKIVRPNI